MAFRKVLVAAILFLIIVSPCLSEAETELNWHWVNPLPQGNNLNDVAFGGGVWVAVGDNGAVLFSNDAIEWIQVDSGVRTNLLGVFSLENVFFAVGEEGTILRSANGIDWTLVDSKTDVSLKSMAYGNGVLVVIGGSVVVWSEDGIDWSIAESNEPLWGLTSVVYGKGTFVASGPSERYLLGTGYKSGTLAVSFNGKQWRRVDDGPVPFYPSGYAPPEYHSFEVMAFGNGTFVGDSIVRDMPYVSENGINWAMSEGTEIVVRPVSLEFSDNIFVALGYEDGNIGKVYTSPDGVDWSLLDLAAIELWRKDQTGDGFHVNGIGIGAGTLIVVGDNGFIFVSKDWESWVELSSGFHEVNFKDVVYGKGVLVASSAAIVKAAHGTWYISPSSYMLSSFDGVNWTETTPETADENMVYRQISLAYGNSTFVAGGDIGASVGGAGEYDAEGPLFSSKDGGIWKERLLRQSTSFYDVEYCNGKFFAMGKTWRNDPGVWQPFLTLQRPVLMSSENGENWTEVSIPTEGFGLDPDGNVGLRGIACGNGRYVAVGGQDRLGNGYAITSNDAQTWTGPYLLGHVAKGFAFGNGVFVLMGQQGSIAQDESQQWVLTSANGVDWSANEVSWPLPEDLIFANGMFLAHGEVGTTTSVDGVNWTLMPETVLRTPQLNALAIWEKSLVAVGDEGAVVATDPFIAPGEPEDNIDPSAPILIAPVEHAVLGGSIDFTWESSVDSDGDTVSYTHYVCSTKKGCIVTQVESQEHGLASRGDAAPNAVGFLAAGLVLTGGLTKRRKLIFVLAVLLTAVTLVVSCGGGGGGKDEGTVVDNGGDGGGTGGTIPEPKTEISATVSGLQPATEYHWFVVAKDGKGGAIASEVRHFTTV